MVVTVSWCGDRKGGDVGLKQACMPAHSRRFLSFSSGEIEQSSEEAGERRNVPGVFPSLRLLFWTRLLRWLISN